LPTPTLQVCRSCGGGAPVDVHFCPQCSKILALGRHGDYFAFLGLPRKLRIDPADLEQRFRALSRQFLPVFFYTADPSERRASLERSSYLNDAYRALKHASSRIDYLLKLEGLGSASPEEASRQVPPGLLEEVFALNEELDDIRELRGSGAPEESWRTRLERAREPILHKQTEHEADLDALSAEWDAVVDRGAAPGERQEILTALRDRFLERNYINNLLHTIESELNG
jgi:molecular chaperone HscB